LSAQRGILIIEDNPADVRLMREALRNVGPPITIHVAVDGQEALRFLRREGEHAGAPQPALIFLDFNLPKADSREILREIKEDDSLRLIPVAVLTSSDAEKDVREAYQLYANCYLRKPGDLDSFLNTVRAAANFWLNVANVPPEIEPGISNSSRLL
jgi:two-component system, chemotaxis family, response regulator Rcp1